MAQHNIEEVSKLTGITVRSLRNYLRRYREHLRPARGLCNALVFSDEDVETFVKIRTLLREGKARPEIHETLRGETDDEPMVVRRADETGGPPAVVRADPALLAQLDRQAALLERLLEQNLALVTRVEDLETQVRMTRERAPRLPAPAPPRQVRVRRRNHLALPLPYFLLRAGDGARAVLSGIATLIRRRPPPRTGPAA